MEVFRIKSEFMYSPGRCYRGRLPSLKEGCVIKMIDDLAVQPVDYDVSGYEGDFSIIFLKECQNRMEALKWAKENEIEMLSEVDDVTSIEHIIKPEKQIRK